MNLNVSENIKSPDVADSKVRLRDRNEDFFDEIFQMLYNKFVRHSGISLLEIILSGGLHNHMLRGRILEWAF